MGELIDTIKGKVKRAIGKVTGNRVRQAEGAADELKGKTKGASEEVKADVRRSLREDQEHRQASNPTHR